jgi:photosynthetic reaction center cytochrome c subunit
MRWMALALAAAACSHTQPPPAPLAVPHGVAAAPAAPPDGGPPARVVPADAGVSDAGAADADTVGDAGVAADAGAVADAGADGGMAMVDIATPMTAAAGNQVPFGLEQRAFDLDWTPEQRHRPAKATFKNLKVLGDVPGERFAAAMQSMRVNVGMKCVACHVIVPKNFASDEKKEKRRAREMISMTAEIDRRTFKDQARVTCWTCHRGDEEPPKMSFSKELPPLFARMPARRLRQPADKVFKNVRELTGMDARNFGLIMGWFAKELGVKCAHCHDVKDFSKDTPKKARAREMLQMTGYVARDYYGGNDSPVGCGTCHRGSVKPPRTPKDIP